MPTLTVRFAMLSIDARPFQICALTLFATILVGCSEGALPKNDPDHGRTYIEFLIELSEVYQSKPANYSRAYAVMKTGVAGRDWLATVHGLPDNLAACEEIIAPYRTDAALTTLQGRYFCEEIEEGFQPFSDFQPQS